MANRIDFGIKERWVFLLSSLIYLSIHWMNQSSVENELLFGHGKDLLAVPILLSAIKTVRELFKLTFDINKKEVIIAVLYLSISFEWVLPNFSTKFVQDPIDIMAYTTGGTIYYLLFIARKKKKQ